MNIHFIFIAMLFMTCASYWVAETGASGGYIVGLVLLTIAVKGFWIINDFMKLKSCAKKWRFIMYGWLIVVVSVIAVFSI